MLCPQLFMVILKWPLSVLSKRFGAAVIKVRTMRTVSRLPINHLVFLRHAIISAFACRRVQTSLTC